MRKSFAWALVLVMALAGAAFAQESEGPSFTATLSGSAEYNSDKGDPDEASFFGTYEMKAGLDFGVSYAPENGAWDATVNFSAGDGAANLGFYRINVKDDAFTATIWGKHENARQSIGNKQDPLAFVRASGNNTAKDPAIRVTGSLAGFDLFGQIPASGGSIYLFGDTTVEQFSIGAGLQHTFATEEDDAFSRYTIYGNTAFDIVEVDAAFAGNSGADKDNTAVGVKIAADVTEQVSVSAAYKNIAENFDADSGDESGTHYTVGAEFTEGLIQISGEYGSFTGTAKDAKAVGNATIGVIYRGSEDNLDFSDLFGDYHENVAPAFAVEYAMDEKEGEPASTITLKATAPVVPGQLWVNGSISFQSNDKGFSVSTGYPVKPTVDENNNSVAESAESRTEVKLAAYAPFGSKLVLKPAITSNTYNKVSGKEVDKDGNTVASGTSVAGSVSSLKVELNGEYAIADNAKLTFGIGQTSWSGNDDYKAQKVERFSKIGFEVEF